MCMPVCEREGDSIRDRLQNFDTHISTFQQFLFQQDHQNNTKCWDNSKILCFQAKNVLVPNETHDIQRQKSFKG